MNTKDSGLIDKLYSTSVINRDEKEYVEAAETSSVGNERLLEILKRKSSQQFQQFESALNETGQQLLLNFSKYILLAMQI
jgi:hypothetical protein